MKRNDNWSENEIGKLKELWPTEKAEYIAQILGRTKNAVFGRAFRLGLMEKKQGRPVGKQKAKLKGINRDLFKRIMSARAAHRPITVASTRPLSYDYPVPLMEANAFHCRAVIEDQVDKDGLAIVCGKLIEPGSTFSFCSDHLSRFTTHRVR